MKTATRFGGSAEEMRELEDWTAERVTIATLNCLIVAKWLIIWQSLLLQIGLVFIKQSLATIDPDHGIGAEFGVRRMCKVIGVGI